MFLLLLFRPIPFQTGYEVVNSGHTASVFAAHVRANVDYLQVCIEKGFVIFLLMHVQLGRCTLVRT